MEKDSYEFHLYVCRKNGEVKEIVDNLHKHLSLFLEGKYKLMVKNIFENNNGESAVKEGVFAVSALVRKTPAPIKQIVGDLSSAKAIQVLLQKNNDELGMNY